MDLKKDLDQASAAYRAKRDELLAAEIALKDQRERVAELRRALPPGPVVETDYTFKEGPRDLADGDPAKIVEVRLSELFQPGQLSLIVDHMMFDPAHDNACPMCALWADGYDGIARHVADRAAFVVVAKAPIEKLRAWGHARGWRDLRLLSAHETSFNQDFLVEQQAAQLPAVSVFTKAEDGTIRHHYTSQASLTFTHHRGIDLMNPVWHLFDLLPEGRGDWFPKHDYG